MSPVMEQVFIEYLLCAKTFTSVRIRFSPYLCSIGGWMFFLFYEGKTDNN